MTDERYVRWHGLGIAQMTVAIALVSGLSVAGLGAGLSLMQSEKFVLCQPFKWLFAGSLLALLLAAFAASAAVVSRLLDFRLTARQMRQRQQPGYVKHTKMFFLNSDAYGRITWEPIRRGQILPFALWNSSFDDRFSVERTRILSEQTASFSGEDCCTPSILQKRWSLRAAERGRWPVSQHGWFTGLEGARPSILRSETNQRIGRVRACGGREAWPRSSRAPRRPPGTSGQSRWPRGRCSSAAAP